MRFKKYRNIQFPNYCEDLESMRAFVLTQQKYIKINLKKKRNKIKFNKNKQRYIKDWVKWRIMGKCLTKPVRRFLDYPGLATKIMIVEPILEGENLIFDRSNK